MARNYEIRFRSAKNLHEILGGVKGKIEDRQQVKKVKRALQNMADHVVDENEQHFWGADLKAPNTGPDGRILSYKFKDGMDARTKRFVRMSPTLVEKAIWDKALKPLLENPQMTEDYENQIRDICEDFQLMDAFERLIPPLEEDESEEGDKDVEASDEPEDAGASEGDKG
jgi:hypothetical protein